MNDEQVERVRVEACAVKRNERANGALTGRRIRRIRKTPGDYYVKFSNPNESYCTGFSP